MSISRRLFALPAMILFAAACSGTDALRPAAPTEGVSMAGTNGRSELPAGIDPKNAAAMRGSALRMSASSEGFETVSKSASAITGPQVITNGVVTLGVRPEGDLNTGVGGYTSANGTYIVGLRYNPTGMEATAAGCTCEGWGVGDRLTGAFGSANSAYEGMANLSVEDYESDGVKAKSVTIAGGVFRVTHFYHPSAQTPNLYEVEVTIENISNQPRDVVYRRVMDWDIEPTPFNEYVTIQRGTSTELIQTDNNGFQYGNPFTFTGSYGYHNVNVVDAGPRDHGAMFDFGFGMLAPGARKTFKTYYGAAGTETAAKAALGAVGAEVYSLGQTRNDPLGGTPNTFIFAFGGVGGAPVEPPPVPVDNSPPTVTPVVAGTLGTGGWYTSNIDISWTVADAQSPITSPACTVSSVTTDTNGATFTCTATSQGGSTTGSVTVMRDASTPTVTPVVTGTLVNGWYTSDVSVSWTVDANGPSGATSSCVVSSQTTDTSNATFNCSATSGAGITGSASTSLKRDATNPTIGYTGNAGIYTIDQNVAITCSAADALSGLASSTCANVTGSAASFALGAHTYSATATDNAGNTSSASTTFTVKATAASLCAMTRLFVTGPGEAGVENSLCVKLEKGHYAPYINEVQAQSGKKISAANAALLILWAQSL